MNRELLNEKLRVLGPSLLYPHWKKRWSPEKPTTGYCYLVSEMLFHYQYPESVPYCIQLGSHGTHWFLKNHGEIVDWTADQFGFPIRYELARRQAFLTGKTPAPRGRISKRGFLLAKYCGLI